MNGIDLTILIVLFVGAYSGFRRGFIQAFAGFISIGAGIWVGLNFSGLLESSVAQYESIPPHLVRLLALILTILLVFLGIRIIAKLIHTAVHTVGLGLINRLGGLVFSLLLSGLTLAAIYYFVSPYLALILDEETLNSSLGIPYLAELSEILKMNVL